MYIACLVTYWDFKQPSRKPSVALCQLDVAKTGQLANIPPRALLARET